MRSTCSTRSRSPSDARGWVVKVPLACHNVLIESIPRQGRTATVRVLACAAALDPLAGLWVAELKGSGDLDALSTVAPGFVSGIDDDSIAYAAESLRLLRAEIGRRAGKSGLLAFIHPRLANPAP